MRAAAADGDKDSFLQGVPSSFKDGDKLIMMFVKIWVFVKNVIWEIWRFETLEMHILQVRFGI